MKLILLIFCWIAAVSVIADASVFNLAGFGGRGDGTTDNRAAFSAAFRALRAAPGARLFLPAGVYRIGTGDEKFIHEHYHQMVSDLRDNTIEGDRAEIVFSNPDHGGWLFRRCRNLRLKGLTFDWNPLPFTQGRIIAVDRDHPRIFTLAVEPGFPEADQQNFQNNAVTGKFMIGFVYDPATGRLFTGKMRDNHKSVEKVEKLRPGVFRLTLRPGSSPDAIAEGRLFVLLSRNPSNGIVFHACEQPVVEDVTLYSSSHIGLLFRSGTDRPVIRRAALVRRPGTTRLISTNADGIFCDGCPRGPVIENCRLDGGMDDGIVLPVNGRPVLERVDEKTFKVRCIWGTLIRPGDRLEGIDRDGRRTGALPPVAAVAPAVVAEVAGKKYHFETVTFARPALKLDAGNYLFNLDMANRDFLVRDNRIENLRGKGIKIHGTGGTAENNTISSTVFGGIEIGFQFANGVWTFMWAENVIVRHNKIDAAAMLGLIQPSPIGWSTAIRVHQGRDDFTFRPNRNIEISDNVVTRSGQAALRVWATEKLRIERNRIDSFNLMAFPSDRAAIDLINVRDAVVTGNTVTGNGSQTDQILRISPSCADVTTKNKVRQP